MESAFFRDFFREFFPREVKNIIFAWRGACEVCLKRTLENSELGKTQNSFLGGREHWWVWQGVGGHTRWVTRGGLCEVDHARWVMQGGLCEVGAGCGGHTRWVTRGGSHKVGYTRWIT